MILIKRIVHQHLTIRYMHQLDPSNPQKQKENRKDGETRNGKNHGDHETKSHKRRSMA